MLISFHLIETSQSIRNANQLTDFDTKSTCSQITQRRTLRSETIFGSWKPFRSDEKCFLYYIKSSFCSQDI